MRIVFAGTPEFAARALEAIIAAGHEPVLVLTQPDRPSGRGLSVHTSAVKRVALGHGLRLHQPATLKDIGSHGPILEACADIMVVAAYGLILPQSVLDIPRLGCINIHASLLPCWRGAAPIQRAILAGDEQTGISIMQMDAGLDTGPVLLARGIPIGPDQSAGELHDVLADLGAGLVVQSLDGLQRGSLAPVPQPAEGATYAAKIDKSEALLDFRRPAEELACRVRAFDPVPGAAARYGDAAVKDPALKIWRAQAIPGSGEAGTVLRAEAAGIDVACGSGVLRIKDLQRAGGKRLAAADFLRGGAIPPGTRFALPSKD